MTQDPRLQQIRKIRKHIDSESFLKYGFWYTIPDDYKSYTQKEQLLFNTYLKCRFYIQYLFRNICNPSAW
jgi:hypothetical protein